MASIDFQTKQIQCKVVWYGIAGSGKSATLNAIYERTQSPDAQRQKLNGADPETAYYDYLPLKLGEIRGFKSTFHLFSVPGRAGYERARYDLLDNVDGIVFTADSRRAKQAENLSCFYELRHALSQRGYNIYALPFVVQCTFCDASDALDLASVAAPLLVGFADPSQIPVIATIPRDGVGVMDATKAVAKLVLAELRKG